MAARIFKAVILGAPASGKGTISQRIVKFFNIKHISSGDKLRQHIQKKTKEVEDEAWLLDGFPRTLSQAIALWEIQKLDLAINLLVPFQAIVDRVKGRRVHLGSGRVYNEGFNAPKVPGVDDVTGEPLIQREDDKPDVVLKRLEQYEKMTGPVIQFYREHGILKEFCGDRTDTIWPQVLECLSTQIPFKNTTQKPS